MHIAFVDPIGWDYDVETPFSRPLGGSQSAVCYLAAALAERGNAVSLWTATTRPGDYRGVACRPLVELTPRALQQLAPDALVLINTAAAAALVRPYLPARSRVVLWTQHAADQPAVAALQDPDCQRQHDAVVFVSRWQQEQYAESFGLTNSSASTVVLRNAVGPAFEQLLAAGEPVLPIKQKPLRLAYTSTPYRGLDRLLRMIPTLRLTHPTVGLDVYSSMNVYQVSLPQDRQEFGTLYDRCRTTEGVHYHGSLPQPELACRLRVAAVLAYPNTFAETSCIAVLEAMAAGCAVVTCRRGALPETTSGFGTLCEGSDDQQFVAALEEIVRRFTDADPTLEAHLQQQVEFVREQCTWKRRAVEWEQWLAGICSG